MKELTIFCDVDGVVANLYPEWFRLYNEDSGDNLTIDNVVTWDVHKYVKPGWGKKIYDYLWFDNLYDHVEPYPGALGAISALRSDGHRVIFLTSGLQPAKIRWLARYGLIDPDLWRTDPDWIIAYDKSLFCGDIMIDDYPKNLEKFFGRRFLVSAPYNMDAVGYIRVRDLTAVVYYLQH